VLADECVVEGSPGNQRAQVDGRDEALDHVVGVDAGGELASLHAKKKKKKKKTKSKKA